MTVEYSEFGKPKTMDGDYLVCAMSAVMLRQIPVTPAWPEAKRWAIENMPYYSATRPVLQSRTKFWREEKVGMNLQFGNPALEHVWSMADEVKTNRGLIVGTAQPGVRPQAALDAFRSMYPGKLDTIESASIIDWSKDPWSSVCETTTYRPGQLHRFLARYSGAARARSLLRSVLRQPELGAGSRHPKREPGRGGDSRSVKYWPGRACLPTRPDPLDLALPNGYVDGLCKLPIDSERDGHLAAPPQRIRQLDVHLIQARKLALGSCKQNRCVHTTDGCVYVRHA